MGACYVPEHQPGGQSLELDAEAEVGVDDAIQAESRAGLNDDMDDIPAVAEQHGDRVAPRREVAQLEVAVLVGEGLATATQAGALGEGAQA